MRHFSNVWIMEKKLVTGSEKIFHLISRIFDWAWT